MTAADLPKHACLVEGCTGRNATWLGVCEAHWLTLTPVLREAWWAAWYADGRVIAWTAARRGAVEYLNRT